MNLLLVGEIPLFNVMWENNSQAIYEACSQMLYEEHKTWPNSSLDQNPNVCPLVYFYYSTAVFIQGSLNSISSLRSISSPKKKKKKDSIEQLNTAIHFPLNLLRKKVLIPSLANRQNRLDLMEGNSEGHRVDWSPLTWEMAERRNWAERTGGKMRLHASRIYCWWIWKYC